MSLISTDPQPGDTYRNIPTGQVGVIVGIIQRRQQWVRVRRDGKVTEVKREWLAEHWRPCRPDGTLR